MKNKYQTKKEQWYTRSLVDTKESLEAEHVNYLPQSNSLVVVDFSSTACIV